MKKPAFAALVGAVLIATVAMPAMAEPLMFPLRPTDGFPLDASPPSVTAASWIIFDDSSDLVLAEWDADTRRPMASITKIMTVMLALEHGDMDDDVVVSSEAAGQGGQEIGLVVGETVKLGALVRAAMIRSGNDSAAAIAEHVGGSIEGFVDMMNERAIELGMTNTRFANPHGLDASGHYSTPRDMLIVSRQAMSMPEFEELARSRVMVFPDTPDGSQRTATNTNRILNSYDGTIGVKTGDTPNAGLTYVGAAERDGRRLFAVVFRSVGRRAHFADAIELFDWAFDDLSIHGTIAAGAPYRPVTARMSTPAAIEEAVVDASDRTEVEASMDQPDSRPAGVISPPSPDPGVDVARTPDPAPDSVLSTVSYWLGLVAGAFDG